MRRFNRQPEPPACRRWTRANIPELGNILHSGHCDLSPLMQPTDRMTHLSVHGIAAINQPQQDTRVEQVFH